MTATERAPGRRGRRPGSPDTRAAVLTAARERFAAKGYAATSVRAVASDAGVDPALVHHYFGSKDDLFLAALEVTVDPRAALAPVVEGGVDGAGERLMRIFVAVWGDEETRLPLMGLVRGIADPGGQQLVRDGFQKMVLGPLGAALGIDQPERRMAHVGSQLVGLVVVRYVLAVEPLASMPPEQLVATYAPVIQGYLSGPLP
ncbi:MAG: TetR family transcriptional regulator [Actinomycetota bacterium]|nr:TetR family transcriptional regulator [Actinomycetota bacterium]